MWRALYAVLGAVVLLAGLAYAQQPSSGGLIACMLDNISTLLAREGVPSSARCTEHRALMVTLYDSDGNEITEFRDTLTPITPGHFTVNNFRCDPSGSLAGTSGPVGGDACASGTWFDAVDARGAVLAGLTVHEYGTGSGAWSLWDCIDPAGSDGTLSGVSAPGVEDPASTPTPSDPDPLCTKINYDPDGAEVIANGVLPHELHFSDRSFNYLIVRTDTCTGNCDATLQLQVRF